MAIDVLSEHKIRRMVPKQFRHRFTYVRMDVTHLDPGKLGQLVWEQWGLLPSQVNHIHYSPPCTTLSRATHGKDSHFSGGLPVSLAARRDYAALVRVLTTLTECDLDPCHTLVTVENPFGRFKDLS